MVLSCLLFIYLLLIKFFRIQHHTNSVSHSFAPMAQVIFPQVTLVLFGSPSGVAVLFPLLHISTSLAQVESGFILGVNTCNFKSYGLPLVLKALLIASKNGLAA